MPDLIPSERIEGAILTLRGQRVMLAADLAALYGVETRALNQAVKRNLARFPDDFMFRLTGEEKAEVITVRDHLSGLKYSAALPYAFTEHGAVMLSAVLNSPTAVQVSVEIARAFVRFRRLLTLEGEIRQRMEALEAHAGNVDSHLVGIYEAIRQLMEPPQTYLIGFRPNET